MTEVAKLVAAYGDLYGSLDTLEKGEVVQVGPTEAEEQAILDWLEARRGRITCSNFDLIMATGRKKDEPFSQAGLKYLNSVVAERLGSTLPEVSGAPLRWGKENETPAVEEYARQSPYTVTPTHHSFAEYSDWVGGSPDARVGDYGQLEIKCPYSPAEHVDTLIKQEVPSKYLWQCHGHILVTDSAWCDFVSFDPRIPEGDDARLCVIRVLRDDTKLNELLDKLNLAVQYVTNAIEAIRSSQQKAKLLALFNELTEQDRSEFLSDVTSAAEEVAA